MKLIECEKQGVSGVDQLNTLTDAACMMQLMEDEQVSHLAMAQYVINNSQENAVLEIDGRELLDFHSAAGHRASQLKHLWNDIAAKAAASTGSGGQASIREHGLTLRKFIGEHDFTALVHAIVELNGGSTYENSNTNVILLDKIRDCERVVTYLVKMQLNNIERSKPREFLKPTLEQHALQQAISKQLAVPNGQI